MTAGLPRDTPRKLSEWVRVSPLARLVLIPAAATGISSTLQIEIINLVREMFKYRALFHLPALLMCSQTETGHGKLVLLR